MFSILIPLGAFLSAGVGYLAVRVLLALGIGFISYAAVIALLTQLFSMAQGHYNNIPSLALSIINLAGIGDGLGIITGSITFRATLLFATKLGVLPK